MNAHSTLEMRFFEKTQNLSDSMFFKVKRVLEHLLCYTDSIKSIKMQT